MENKYLEKIARKDYRRNGPSPKDTLEVSSDGFVLNHQNSLDSKIAKAKNITPSKPLNLKKGVKIGGAALAVGAAGAGAVYGAKKLYEKAQSMRKQAMDLSTKKEIANTATIGAVGVGTAALGTLIGKRLNVGSSVKKMALIGGGLGLAGDYGAVKLNKKINNKLDTI